MLHDPEVMYTCDGFVCTEFVNVRMVNSGFGWGLDTMSTPEKWVFNGSHHFCSQACADSQAPQGDADVTSI